MTRDGGRFKVDSAKDSITSQRIQLFPKDASAMEGNVGDEEEKLASVFEESAEMVVAEENG